MEGSMIQLSQYRFQRALEMLEDAKIFLEQRSFASSVNRSYYAVFHAMRAITALDSFDSSKHSGIIAYINRVYVKEGIFDKQLSKILDTAFRIREKADYDDFFVVSCEMAKDQLDKANIVIDMTKAYLTIQWNGVVTVKS